METKYQGTYGKEDFRVYLHDENGRKISFIDNVMLCTNDNPKIFNMIVEIPKNTSYKLEIDKDNHFNPIKHDKRGGVLRFTDNPYPFNYGAFPQTWENPDKKDNLLDCYGDNDPLDVCEIGTKIHNPGDIIQVIVLGAYAMIDNNEADWKIIAIDITDHELDKYLDPTYLIEDKHDIILHFLKYYKVKDGKHPNKFGFEGKMLDADTALKIIEDANKEYYDKKESLKEVIYL